MLPDATLPVLLKNPYVLLIGGGGVALHKANVLHSNGVRFRVIARTLRPEFANFGVPLTERSVTPDDITASCIVVDATGNPDVRQMLLNIKQTRPLMLNCVDDPQVSDFFFSSLLQYGRLKIAISSDGASPTATQVVREKVRAVLSEQVAGAVEERGVLRSRGVIDKKASALAVKKALHTVTEIASSSVIAVSDAVAMSVADVVFVGDEADASLFPLIPQRAEVAPLGEYPARKEALEESGARVVVLR